MKKADSQNDAAKFLKKKSTVSEGFLGSDTRSLAAILRVDDEAVRRRGLTHARIAQRLLALRKAGWEGMGEPLGVSPHFEVIVDAARGKAACPFGDPGSFAKVNTTVRNLERGTQVTFTDLNIHLIAAHGFYEGYGAPFRIDPEQLIDTLEMERDKRDCCL